MNVKQIISEEIEEKLVCIVLSFIKEEGLTIANTKEAMGKVYSHMEKNAKIKTT